MGIGFRTTELLLIIICICMMTGCKSMDGKAEYTANSEVKDVVGNPAFEGYGRLIFPADLSIDSNLKLQDIGSALPWYSEVNADKTVEILNDMNDKASNGKKIFYDIYTENEKNKDPEKRNTGLFFFCGNSGEKTAIVNAGGGFVYVAGIQDVYKRQALRSGSFCGRLMASKDLRLKKENVSTSYKPYPTSVLSIFSRKVCRSVGRALATPVIMVEGILLYPT